MLGNLLIWSFVWRSFFESYSLFYFLPTIHSVRFVYGFLKYANSRHIFASWTSDFLILFLVKIQNSCASFLPPMATDAARFFVNLLEMYPCSFRTTTIPPLPPANRIYGRYLAAGMGNTVWGILGGFLNTFAPLFSVPYTLLRFIVNCSCCFVIYCDSLEFCLNDRESSGIASLKDTFVK